MLAAVPVGNSGCTATVNRMYARVNKTAPRASGMSAARIAAAMHAIAAAERLKRYDDAGTTSAYVQNGHLTRSSPQRSSESAAVLSSRCWNTSRGRTASRRSSGTNASQGGVAEEERHRTEHISPTRFRPWPYRPSCTLFKRQPWQKKCAAPQAAISSQA